MVDKTKNRIVRIKNSSVEHAFNKETQLIKQMQSGELEQCLMLWQSQQPTLVLPASNKWQTSTDFEKQLNDNGWQLLSRRTGGAPVPQTAGVINLSHLYVWPKAVPYSITQAYKNLCEVLTQFFANQGVKTHVHATPYSYCDGDYNVNINDKKIVGTAQRVILKSGGDKIVLAQACILIDADMTQLVSPVNQCYQDCGHEERVKADVHTCLFEHLTEKPSIDELYQALTQAFIDSKLYR